MFFSQAFYYIEDVLTTMLQPRDGDERVAAAAELLGRRGDRAPLRLGGCHRQGRPHLLCQVSRTRTLVLSSSERGLTIFSSDDSPPTSMRPVQSMPE